MLKKGDKVVMHTCLEAETYNGKIWTCETDEQIKGEGCYKQGLVFLEGFGSCFSTEFLQKVDLKEITRVIARNCIAWDTSKDKREGLLPEVAVFANPSMYEELTGEKYFYHKACKKFL